MYYLLFVHILLWKSSHKKKSQNVTIKIVQWLHLVVFI